MEVPTGEEHTHGVHGEQPPELDVPAMEDAATVVHAPQPVPPPSAASDVPPPPYQFPTMTKYAEYTAEPGYGHMQYHPKAQPETYFVTVRISICAAIQDKLMFAGHATAVLAVVKA